MRAAASSSTSPARSTGDGWLARAADERPQPGDQLVEVERLGEIVVGAEVEIGDLVGRGVAGGEHQHRRDLGLAQLAEHLAAVQPRQHEVEDDGVVVGLLGLAQALFAVGGDVDGEARLARAPAAARGSDRVRLRR